jgi:hypothetical protein
LVAVTSKSFTWFVDGFTIHTWAIFTFKAHILMNISTEWTVTSIDTMFVYTSSTFWVETRWSTRRSTDMIFLTFWALDWTSSFSTPFNMDTVPRTFTEVSSHGVTWSNIFQIFVFHFANVFFTRVKVDSWINNISAKSIHDVRA